MQDLTVSATRGFGPLAGGGWLVDELMFRFLVDFEIQKAQRLRYSVSLVCFAVEPESTGNGGTWRASVADALARDLRSTDAGAPVADARARYRRSTDAVALSTQGWLSMLLVDAETTHLPSIVDRLATRL